MGAMCKIMCGTFPTYDSTEFGDEYFKYFERDPPLRKTLPELAKVQNEYMMEMMKVGSVLDYKKDMGKARAALSKM